MLRRANRGHQWGEYGLDQKVFEFFVPAVGRNDFKIVKEPPNWE